jgi:hypothetical protein
VRVLAWARARAWLAGWILASRAVVLTCTLLLTSTRHPRGDFSDAVLERPLGPLAAWDGRWYGEVAKHGYSLAADEKSSAAFFPLYPRVLRWGHDLLGWEYLTAGLVASNLLFAVGVFALYELGRSLLPERQARRAAVYATVFPLGFVFSMLYAESLAFAAVSLAALCAVRGRWLASVPFAAAAALARPGGVFVVLPILAAAVAAWPALTRAGRLAACSAGAAAPLALVLLPIYQWRATGDLLAWSHAQAAWGRSFGPAGAWHAIVALPDGIAADPWLARDAAFVAAYAVLLLVARRTGVGRAWVAAAALMAFLPLASGTFESAGRLGMIAPPLYWGLAALTPRAPAYRALVVASALLLAAGTLTLGFVNP